MAATIIISLKKFHIILNGHNLNISKTMNLKFWEYIYNGALYLLKNYF